MTLEIEGIGGNLELVKPSAQSRSLSMAIDVRRMTSTAPADRAKFSGVEQEHRAEAHVAAGSQSPEERADEQCVC